MIHIPRKGGEIQPELLFVMSELAPKLGKDLVQIINYWKQKGSGPGVLL